MFSILKSYLGKNAHTEKPGLEHVLPCALAGTLFPVVFMGDELEAQRVPGGGQYSHATNRFYFADS